MIRRASLLAGILGALSVSGCLSLNYDEDVRQINHYGKSLEELRKTTNKYFWDYDQDDPFAD